MGSELQEHELIFDTGSPWLWLPTKECKQCHTSNLFDSSASTTFVKASTEKKEMLYEKGSASGYIVSDRVCLDGNTTSCVDD